MIGRPRGGWAVTVLLGACADGLERLVHDELAVSENLPKHVGLRVAVALSDGLPLVHRSLKSQLSSLRPLAGVCDGILLDVDALAIHLGVRALEGTLLGVTVQLLQQSAATAEGHVVYGPAFLQHGLHYHLEGGDVDSISLENADARRQQFVS